MPFDLKLFRLGILSVLMSVMLMGSIWLREGAQAQNVSDFLNLNNPVEYDPVRQVGRARQRPDSIDQCLFRKEWFFNELHNIWVDGLERCKRNSKRILSRASAGNPDASNDPVDEQACVGKGDGQILTHGVPSESQARGWSDHCSYLGTIGGAGPQGTTSSSTSNYDLYFNSQGGQPVGITGTNTAPSGSSGSSVSQTPLTGQQLQDSQQSLKDFFEGGFKPTIKGGTDTYQREYERLTPEQRSTFFTNDQIRSFNTQFYGSPTGGPQNAGSFTPVYTGVGVQVPDVSLAPGGISKETSLIKLIVFYTNATLPYVSVISVFVFVAAGLFYILSFTNEDLNAQAKSMMTYVVIGIVIIFSAYTIVNTLLSFSSFAGS